MTTIEAIGKIEKATDGAVLFRIADYRTLAKLVHPDVTDAKLKPRAAAAFAKLSAFNAAANGKTPTPGATIIGKWVVSDAIAHGDIADLYRANRVSDQTEAVFKIARAPKDGDLVEQEYFALKHLHASKLTDGFKKYLPVVIETLEASGRRANVLTPAAGMALSEIIQIEPHLEFRHIVWMVNRSLSVLGFAHKNGIVHGAVIPEHLIFGPQSHGLILVDWCYSVTAESKKNIAAMVAARKSLYPEEVKRKWPAVPSTDIFMLFASMKATGAVIPRRFKGIFEWCMAESPKTRPQDAWELQERWLAVAKEEYGEPKFVELAIPVT